MEKKVKEAVETTEEQVQEVQKTMRVRNRNDYKVELMFNGQIVVFPAHKTVSVSTEFQIPSNMGLYVV